MERLITHGTFTKEDRERIRLAANPETRQYIETLEAIAIAGDALMQANDEMTRSRVKMGQWLMQVNFMK